MENQKTIKLITALNSLVQKTESVISDFSINQLAKEIIDTIKSIGPQDEWFSQQLGFFVHVEILEGYDSSTHNSEEVKKNVLQELNRLSCLTANVSGVSGLLPPEIVVTNILTEVLNEEKYLIILRSLQQAFVAEYRHDIAIQFIEFLKTNPDKIQAILASEKRSFFILLLDITWLALFSLPVSMIQFVVSTVFFQSVKWLCPVEIGLHQFLSTATHFDQYENKVMLIIKQLLTSREHLFPEDTQDSTSVSDFFVNYINPEWLKGQTKLLEQEIAIDTVKIFDNLKNLKIGRPFSDENSLSNEYEEDLMQLADWFSDYESWNLIAVYYKQEKPAAPFKFFLKNIVDFFQINNLETAEIMVEFQKFCHENGILPVNQELLFWNENTGQFEWNSELLS